LKKPDSILLAAAAVAVQPESEPASAIERKSREYNAATPGLTDIDTNNPGCLTAV
jgi:hypothetical protein